MNHAKGDVTMQVCAGVAINAASELSQPVTRIAPLERTEAAEAEWDTFVETAPAATFSHLAGWRRVFEDVMRHRATYLAAHTDDGTVAGVLPLVSLRSLLFGRRMVSVPYLNDGGPLGSDATAALLVERAIELARSEGDRLQLRLRHVIGDHADNAGDTGDAGKVTVLLDLPSEPSLLWSELPSKLRSQVRRPQKAGLSTRFGVTELPAFYEVWSRNMRDLGTPVLPRAFFEAIARAFPARFMVGCVYREDVPIAAGAGFLFRDEFEITWASALREHNRDAPNMLLYWAFMEKAIQAGAGTFNFGRCTPGEGTHRFKLQWGGRTVPLSWIDRPEQTKDDDGPGRAARMASSLWQRLPAPVANRLGPVVARQLPWW